MGVGVCDALATQAPLVDAFTGCGRGGRDGEVAEDVRSSVRFGPGFTGHALGK